MLGTPKGLSDEKAARMITALREGRTLRTFGVKVPRLEAYFKAHPEYAQEALPLIEANAKTAHLRKGAHIRNKTHCINGHSLAEHGRVAMHKGWKTRQCRACEVMRYQHLPFVSHCTRFKRRRVNLGQLTNSQTVPSRVREYLNRRFLRMSVWQLHLSCRQFMALAFQGGQTALDSPNSVHEILQVCSRFGSSLERAGRLPRLRRTV
jgi:hypothetical protein